MENQYNVGDVVRLKSGGPKMTVTEAARDSVGVDTVWCKWFEGAKQCGGDFPANAVETA